MKKTYLCTFLTFLALAILSDIHAQKIEWLVEPTLTDIDLIIDPETTSHDAFIVKKDNKYGIKSLNDEVIVPIIYKRISPWENGKYFALRTMEDKLIYVDNQGYEIEKEFLEAVDKKNQQQTVLTKIEKLNNSVSSKYPQLRVVTNTSGRNGSMCLMNTKGDTLMVGKFIEMYLHVVNDNFIAYSEGNKLKIVDGTGNILKESVGEIWRKKDYGEYVVIKEGKNPPVIYTQNLIPVLPSHQEFLDYISEYGIFWVKENDKTFLLDENLRKVFEVGAETSFRLKDGSGVIVNSGRMCKKYLYATKETKEYDFTISNKMSNSSYYMVVQDSLRGSYDMDNDKMIIPLNYKLLYSGNPELTLAYNYYDKSIAQIKKMKKPYVAFNNQGVEVFQDTSYNFLVVPGQGIIKLITEGKHQLQDLDGNIITAELNASKIKMSKDSDFIIITDGGTDKYYLCADYKNLDNARYYSAIGKKMKLKEFSIFPVAIKNKWGIIDVNGKELYPFELDSIIEKSYNGLFSVKKNGKSGILEIK